ncbi:hypothetical protein [Gilvimarinus xylanilyticus]|uniref:Uncharacterized protein n=1 Tax=Gilvimarinus xylanilyticus TaxID=2944139 RepID=A0A9X2HYH0_9GAMM|nr:hypothetical protein [Gilvimarinus xylanilyticus]MCP8900355.1 hypothetical protein [Gilvimarinus xylanilyticus]
MHLLDILATHPKPADKGVPDWMLGYFKRRSISFANGDTDTQTHVCWLQSRNFTIDLRLPIESEQVPEKRWADYSAAELRTLGNYEGWVADSVWNGETLAWKNEVALQLHGRWQEPAYLHRVGNCMMEFCPSDAYAEDWRLQPSKPGPLVGLRLTREINKTTGQQIRRDGGLITCGDYAALVLGRPSSIASSDTNALREMAEQSVGDQNRLSALFEFETSVAKGSLADGYTIQLSTRPDRQGKTLISLDGFRLADDPDSLTQTCTSENGEVIERHYRIDTIETEIPYAQHTSTTAQARQWFNAESETLCRYTQPCY